MDRSVDLLSWAASTLDQLHAATGDVYFNDEVHSLVAHFEARATDAVDADVGRDLDVMAAALKIALLRRAE